MTGRQRTEPTLADIRPAPSVDDLLQSATDLAAAPATGLAAVSIARRRPMAPVPEPTEPQPSVQPSADAEPDPDVEPDADAEPDPDLEPDADVDAEPDTRPVEPTRPAPTKPDDRRARSKGKTKASAKPGTKTGTKAGTKAGFKAEPTVPPPAPSAPEPEISAHPIPDFYPSQHEPTLAPARAVLPTAEDSGQLGLTVQEVADAAIERLRDAENATLRHLAALEAEALRRAELLTAQAELDAELIRLTARREAHAIISAARAHTGAGAGAAHLRETRQLGEISDAVSRFAESIDAGLTPPRGAEDEERS